MCVEVVSTAPPPRRVPESNRRHRHGSPGGLEQRAASQETHRPYAAGPRSLKLTVLVVAVGEYCCDPPVECGGDVFCSGSTHEVLRLRRLRFLRSGGPFTDGVRRPQTRAGYATGAAAPSAVPAARGGGRACGSHVGGGLRGRGLGELGAHNPRGGNNLSNPRVPVGRYRVSTTLGFSLKPLVLMAPLWGAPSGSRYRTRLARTPCLWRILR